MLHTVLEVEDPLRLCFEDDPEPYENTRPKRDRLFHAESMEGFIIFETQFGLKREQVRLRSHKIVGLARDGWTVVRSAILVSVSKGLPMLRERRSFPPLDGSDESLP